VGRKSEEKNLETLIRALPLLPEVYRCIFIGQGDTQPYRALAQALNVEDRCFWIDAIKNSQLPLWYSWCDCMCTPSLREGFGVVFIEAAACGAPIVTSDIEPMNKYLTHDVSACLIKEYQDPTALSAAIQRVCEDDIYRKSISEGAVQAAQPFDRNVVDAQEAAIYHEAMNLGPLSLSRHWEIRAWKAQTKIASLLGKTSLRRVARAVVNEKATLAKHFSHSCKPKVLNLKYVIFGTRINRNQWDGNRSKTYQDLMTWSWEETRQHASNYFIRLSFSISKVRGKVLEVGCGIGTMTRWLAASKEVEHIWAIDAFEEAIEKLKSYNLPKVTPIKMSVEGLEFEPGIIFDTVIICEVIEHLYPDEERQMLNALFNSVNSKTRYVLSVPIGWLPDQYHVRGFSRNDFKKHLRKFYGEPVQVNYDSGYSQVAWGYFKS
jgi:2-polyprenyl-3-methyl-5-hydroxy-6-metoxy-1,4-benzoquinol methylase